MKKQPTVPPVGDQAPSPSELGCPIPHPFRLTQYACRNHPRIVLPINMWYIRTFGMVWYRQDIFSKFREAQFQFFLGLENFYDFPFNLFNVSCVRSFFLFRHCCYSFLRATARFWHPKLMLGFIGFVVYAVYDTSKRQSAQQTSGRISSPPPQQSNYQIGDNVPVGYMGYKIVGVRWNDQLTKNPYLNARPNSHYLVVEIFVVNMDKKARTIPPFSPRGRERRRV
jgi:hypothetical protein